MSTYTFTLCSSRGDHTVFVSASDEAAAACIGAAVVMAERPEIVGGVNIKTSARIATHDEIAAASAFAAGRKVIFDYRDVHVTLDAENKDAAT